MHVGEYVGVVGPTGGGKSTLFRLLKRIYDPALPVGDDETTDVEKGSPGEIFIDGIPIKQFRTSWIRRNIGWVTQHAAILPGSIASNISFGSNASRDEVVWAAKQALCHDFIVKKPHGYDSECSELSGGEKQRISIARVLLQKPQVLLLDEATSALDSKTEKALQESIHKWMGGNGV